MDVSTSAYYYEIYAHFKIIVEWLFYCVLL